MIGNVQSQIFYEIALAIGNNHDLEKMLREALSVFVRKLTCRAGAVYQLEDKKEPERAVTVPRRVKGLVPMEAAAQYIKEGHALPVLLEAYGQTTYIEELPLFGAIVLVKSGEPFPKEISHSLPRLYEKLAKACQACLQAEKIKKSEELYRLLVNTSRDAILMTDMAGTILFASSAAEGIYGWPQKILEGATLEQCLELTVEKETLLSGFQKMMRGEPGHLQPYRVIGENKELRWLDHSWDVAKRGDQLGGVIHFVRDITAELQAERRHSGLVRILPAAIYYRPLDRAGEASFISHQIREILGYAPDEVIGKPNFFQEVLHPEDRDWVTETQKSFKPGERKTTYSVSYRMIHKDGHTVWILNHLLAVRQVDGTPEYVCGILMDITERKKVEENLALEEKRRERLQRLLSPSIAQEVISGNVDIEKGGELRETTVLFSDIRGFTSMSESNSPQDIVNLLNEYFERMIEVLFKYEGTLDKFIGDEIMALFGAPVSHEDDPVRAVQAAIEMRQVLAAFNQERADMGLHPVQVGMGINTGECIAGYLGSSQALDYTVIGDTVNVASRLCSVAKPGEIIISEATYDCVKDFVQVQEYPSAVVKGKAQPLRNYNVLGLKSLF